MPARRDRGTVPSPLHVVLHGGTRLLVRRATPDDRERLVEGFAGLSTRSRYLRFQRSVDELDDAMIEQLLDVDQVHHLAWVALDEDAPDVPGAGVVRVIRLEDEPDVGELAITTADDYQGRGVGTLLLAVVAVDAGHNDFTSLRSWVMEDNTTMLDTLREMDGALSEYDFDVLQVDQPVLTDRGSLPDTTAGRVTRQLLDHLAGPREQPLRLGDHGDAPDVPPRRSGQERGSLSHWLDASMDDLP